MKNPALLDLLGGIQSVTLGEPSSQQRWTLASLGCSFNAFAGCLHLNPVALTPSKNDQ